MKKTVYIDSTIPSYYYESRLDVQAFTHVTRKWWDTQRDQYRLLISEFTITELSSGYYPEKKKTLGLVSKLEVLPSNLMIDTIAKRYIKEFVMPKGAFGDAFHLACASWHMVDFLLTWNCNHLANANKQTHIRVINERLRISVPRIITPLELFKEEA